MAEVTSADAVRAAAREFNALGEDAFLYEYDFAPASDCVVVVDGQLYPAVPLLAAAHGHQYPDLGPLADSDLGGRLETAVKLRKLGLEVRGHDDDHEV